ncbi:hypothetical protein ACFYNO_33355 [Kitasatospora sp. NPDC006697]|uniref:hypothetical protein n=1 Tax=Kitasatospora sp. NPDC006697 TaxID=3364020 RepID=UPI0036A91606
MSRRTALGVVLIGAVVAAATAIVVTTEPPRPAAIAITSVPRGEWLRLQDLQSRLPGVGSAADYDLAFGTLSDRCLESEANLSDEVQSVLGLLQQHGIDDENRLTVMRHLAAVLPTTLKQTCATVANAYVTVREESA